MQNSRKRYILLSIVILIPLLLSFLVGLYGVRADKFGKGSWQETYKKEYLEFKGADAVEEKIEEYLKYGVSPLYTYYDSTPVISETIKNTAGEELFKFKVYQALVVKDAEKDDSVNTLQYFIFIYDIQYLKLREMFKAVHTDEGMKADIDKAEVPELSVVLKEVVADDEDARSKIPAKNYYRIILDMGSDVDTTEGKKVDRNDGETYDFVYIYNSSLQITQKEDFIDTVNFEITASIESIKADDDKALTIDVAKLENKKINVDPDYEVKAMFAELEESYQQDLNRTGYFGWMFGRYLWWICLITFVAVGAITFSFYAVWLAEEKIQAAKPKSQIARPRKK